MTKQIRVRFAPSPTGALHIGGIRTALFNYLFAKKNNGTFFLRIEDTDRNRFEPDAEQYILDALSWLGISPTETVGVNEKYGPYRQSERTTIYKKYINQLLDLGHAYYAFDTAEELHQYRKNAENESTVFVYNHNNRHLLRNSMSMPATETTRLLASDHLYVIRFKNPTNEKLHLTDIIRGDVSFETALLDDKILYKSDGLPTYHFANVVDDHLMETSHVIRGEEWLPSLPLHYMLYRAFDWDVPQFAHLPLILKPTGNGKLSKRDGEKHGFPVFPLTWQTKKGYKETGYFPEAVINFLALLGWNDGTSQEILSLSTLEEKFDLTQVHKAGAKFDPEKNKWFNHQYMLMQNNDHLAQQYIHELQTKGIECSLNKARQIISLIKERANFTTEFWDLSSYLFDEPISYDQKSIGSWTVETLNNLKQIIQILNIQQDFTANTIEKAIKQYALDAEISIGKLMQPLRISLVGTLQGIQVFDIMAIIGRDETIQRIKKATQLITK